MASFAGIVDYDPTELVVTARAGTRVADIDDALAARGQMLGCDAPRFGAGATLGGLVATGLSGPRRPYAGAVRDLVLGVRIVDGKGDDLSFGGRVMKNVAGFDVARLMTGALGTLGVLTEVSMKCLPLPKIEATHALECSADDAIRRTNEWGGKPLPDLGDLPSLRAGSPCALSGSAAAVEAATAKIGGTAMRRRGRVLGEHSRPHAPSFRRGGRARCAAVAAFGEAHGAVSGPGRRAADRMGRRIAMARCGRRAPMRREVRAWAHGNGGHATLFRATDKSAGRVPSAARGDASVASAPQGDLRSGGHSQSRPALSGFLTALETALADFIRDTPEGREADAILRSCVHCGFCTATCPTYQLLGDDLDSPRGRIYLIKQALEGGEVTAKTRLHLDRCLTCRSCETTCPSGVKYGDFSTSAGTSSTSARRVRCPKEPRAGCCAKRCSLGRSSAARSRSAAR